MLISLNISRISAFSGSQKSRMLFFVLINVTMPTIVGIITFMSRKNFMLNCVEHEKFFITLGSGCEVIKFLPCSTQLSMKLFLLINVKMPTIVGILTFMSRKNIILCLSEPIKCPIS